MEVFLRWALGLKAFTAGGALFMLHTSRATFSRVLSLNVFIESGGKAVFLMALSLDVLTRPNCGEARPEILTDHAI